jgi:hypothetical protein
MGNESPEAQISGGKAARFANAFQLCSGYREPEIASAASFNPVTKDFADNPRQTYCLG